MFVNQQSINNGVTCAGDGDGGCKGNNRNVDLHGVRDLIKVQLSEVSQR